MASVDGLVTGMSTTDTINQLMKLEAAPQTALKTKISTANKVVTAYQSINTRMSSLVSAAKALGSPDTWTAMKATASSDAAAVTAAAGAAPGSLSFRVKELAATHTVTYREGSVASAGAAVLPDGATTFDITVADDTAPGGRRTIPLTPKDNTLQSVVAAINGEKDAPYTAAAVQIGPGKYTMQLTAKESGSAAATALTDLGGPAGLTLTDPAVTFQGADAKLVVGAGAGAYDITSKSNSFADVLPGVTVTAAKVQADTEPPATISVTADVDAVAAKVQALVDNANVALSEIASQSKIKSGEIAAGPLVGDSAMRKLTQDILGAVSSGVAGLGSSGTASLKDVGVGIGEGGKLTFEKKDFVKAYTADPVKTQQYFVAYTDKPGGTGGTFEPGFDIANGMARKLEATALIASEGALNPLEPTKPRQGTLPALMQRRNDNIRGLNEQVSAWDIRLESRKAGLQKQFAGLEVALGKMQQQSSWLAGQLASLS